MRKINFSGFETGTGIRVVGNGEAIDKTWAARPTPTHECIKYVKDGVSNEAWTGLSVVLHRCVNGKVGGSAWAEGEAPPMWFSRDNAIGAVGDNRLLTEQTNWTWPDSLLIGGTADIYRITNGVMSHVRRSEVVDANLKGWRPSGYTANLSITKKITHYAKGGMQIWVSVCAFEGEKTTAEHGARSASVLYTLPDPITPASSDDDDMGIPSDTTPGVSALAAPQNVTVTPVGDGSSFTISYDAVAGANGYTVYITTDDPALHPAVRYIDLEDDGGDPVGPTDFYVIHQQKMTATKDELATPITWGSESVYNGFKPFGATSAKFNEDPNDTWEFREFDLSGDQNPDQARLGDYYLRRTLGPNIPGDDSVGWHSSSGTSSLYKVEPGATYKWQRWMRADKPVTVWVQPWAGSNDEQYCNVTTEWQEFEISWTVPQDYSGSGSTRTRWEHPSGVVLDHTGSRLWRTDRGNAYHDLLEPINELIEPNMWLRDQDNVYGSPFLADAKSLTSPPGNSPRGTTLWSHIQQCLQAGGKPWFQLEPVLPIEHWIDAFAWLCAPVSSGHPMALKRQAQGRTEPWCDAFEEFIIEPGIELWNSAAGFFTVKPMIDAATGSTRTKGEVYGAWCKLISDQLEAQEWWPDNVIWYIGGAAGSSYGAEAVERFGKPCISGPAAYLGGWESSGENTPAPGAGVWYGIALGDVEYKETNYFVPRENEYKTATANAGMTYGTDVRIGTYEGGPGYHAGSISDEDKIREEVVMKSRAVGTATLDTTLRMAARGWEFATFHTVGQGDGWSARAEETQGNGIYPAYALLSILHAAVAPAKVYELSTTRKGGSQIVHRRDGLLHEVDLISAYALQSVEDPTTWVVVAINRELDRSKLDPDDSEYDPTPVAPRRVLVATKWASVGGASRWVNGGNYREHNRYNPGLRLVEDGSYEADPTSVAIEYTEETIAIPSDPGWLEFTIDPGGCEILKLTGVN